MKEYIAFTPRLAGKSSFESAFKNNDNLSKEEFERLYFCVPEICYDWPEARRGELASGIYSHMCQCGKSYLGYKRRNICYPCFDESERRCKV